MRAQPSLSPRHCVLVYPIVHLSRQRASLHSMLEAAALQRRRSLVFAYCSEIVGPLLRVAARMRADGPPTPPATWRRVVILGSSHIGDVLYRTSSLAALRRAFPDAHITYACASDTRALLDTNPDIDAVLALNDDERSWPWSERVRSMLRAERFDAALCSNHHVYHADLMLAAMLGIPNRVAFVHKGFSGLATVPLPGNYPRPSPMYFRSMVASLAGTAPDWPLDPVLHLTAQDRAAADNGRVHAHRATGSHARMAARAISGGARGAQSRDATAGRVLRQPGRRAVAARGGRAGVVSQSGAGRSTWTAGIGRVPLAVRRPAGRRFRAAAHCECRTDTGRVHSQPVRLACGVRAVLGQRDR